MSDEEQEDKGLLGKLGDKAKDQAKKGIETVGKKTKEAANKGAQKMGEKASEMIKESMESDQKKEGASRSHKMQDVARQSANNLDNQVRTWQGWFWSTIAYGFMITLSFIISSTDARFTLLPIVLLIGFPFYLYYAIINSIPELKIGNRVIFSRKNLSMKDQLSFTSKVAQTFSKEMIKNSPLGATLIFGFLILLGFVIIAPLLGL